MPDLSGSLYSEIDAANSAAAPNGMPEGMPPSGVNDAWRAGMGALMRFWGRIQGRYATAGAANAYMLSPDAPLAAYATGERYSFRANAANTGAATLDISSLGAKAIKKIGTSGKADLDSGDIQQGQPVTVEYDGTDMVMVTPPAGAVTGFVVGDLPTKAAPAGADSVVIMDAADSSKAKTATIAHLLSGSVAQVVKTETGTVAIGTTSIPDDNTVPQSTEGDQYMSVSITPTNTSSTLVIDVVAHLSHASTSNKILCGGLFQDSGASAIAVGAGAMPPGTGVQICCVIFRHVMTAGTTSATALKFRAGIDQSTNGGTVTFNGVGGSQLYGGVLASSIVITEYRP